jgi:hypothetical protein
MKTVIADRRLPTTVTTLEGIKFERSVCELRELRQATFYGGSES